MENQQAVQYLDSLIGNILRIRTSHTRLFVGTFKCTDNDRNIILSTTHQHGYPTPMTLKEAAGKRASSNEGSVKLDTISRSIGLVVVPGQYITKIEVEDATTR